MRGCAYNIIPTLLTDLMSSLSIEMNNAMYVTTSATQTKQAFASYSSMMAK